MAFDPSIILAGRPPQVNFTLPDPMEQFQRGLTLRALMLQGQAGELGLQQQRLQLEQAQREAKERQDFGDYLAHHLGTAPPTAAAPPPAASPQSGATLGSLMAPAPVAAAPPVMASGGTDFGDLHAGEIISRFPTVGIPYLKSAGALQQQQAEAAIKQHDAAMGNADELGRIGISIRDSKDPASQFPIGVMQAVSKRLLPPEIGRQMIADGYDRHKNDIDAFIAQAQNAKDYSETAKNNLEVLQKSRNDAAVSIRAVNDQAGYTPWLAKQHRQIQADLGPTYSPQLKNIVQDWSVSAADMPKTIDTRRAAAAPVLAQAFKQGPAAYAAKLAQFPQDVQDAYAGVGSTDEISQRALTAEQAVRAAQEARTATETNRHDLAAEATAKLNSSIAQAHLNIARTADARAEQVYQNTYGPDANQALVGVDPKLRKEAASKAQKYAEDYTRADAAAANMQSIIDLARSGNKVAYAYAPTTGVLTINTAQGVKRVNMPEIKSYGGAGSAADQIMGWLGKQTTGASIPKEILDNMEQVNKSISDSAGATYDKNLDSLNQNYHSNYKRAVKASSGGQPPAAQHVIEINGKHYRYKGSGATDDLANYTEVK